jgi:peptidoglycan/LPS O-acetylase OafA/YrhL
VKPPRPLEYGSEPRRRSPNRPVWAWVLLVTILAIASLILLFSARHKAAAGLYCAAFVALGMALLMLPGVVVKVWAFFNWPMSEMEDFDDFEGLWLIRLLGVGLIGLAGLLTYIAW